jgi:DNA-binding IclR family transcriptional regulator
MTVQTTVQGTAAFSKSIGVLSEVAEAATPPDMAELIKITGFPRGTLHRIVQSLIAERLITAREDKTFVLAPRIIQLAARALEQNDISRLAEPALGILCDKTKETVHFAVNNDDSMVYTCKKDSPHAIRIASSLGESVPWHASAIAQSVLAAMPSDGQKRIVRSLKLGKFTKHTLTKKRELENRLKEVSKQGYSVAHQETDLDIECYGVAVKDADGFPVAGFSVSVPLFRHTGNPEDYVKPMLACRDSIEKMLLKI